TVSQTTKGRETKSQRIVNAVGVWTHCWSDDDIGRVATAFDGEWSGGGKLDG
ncbi:MAG: hypothetical protein LQ341_005659, partial [Variospora aurantia]